MAFKCSLRDKKILFTLKNENLPLSCSLNYNIQADERINSSNTFVLQLLSLLGVKQWNDFVKGPIIWPHGCEKRHLPWTRCKVTLPLRCVDSLAPLDTLPWRDKTFWAVSSHVSALSPPKCVVQTPAEKSRVGGERVGKVLHPLKQEWEETVWAALGSNGVLFWTLQAAQQKRRQNLLQASPPLPRQGWQLLKIVVGPHSATSCRALALLPCLSLQCFHWVELDGEGNQQHPAEGGKSSWHECNLWTGQWQVLHCCMDHSTRMPKNKRNLYSGRPGTRRDQQ